MTTSSFSFRTLLIALISAGMLFLIIVLGLELRSQNQELQALSNLTVSQVASNSALSPSSSRASTFDSSPSSSPDQSFPSTTSAPLSQPTPAADEEMVVIEEPAPTPEPLIVPAAVHSSRATVSVSPDEQAVLNEAAQQFSTALQGMSPYAPGYREAWQKAAQDADDLFKVRYGEDRLWALKGGPPPPTPTPTPLSPEDDAYRAKYGDDALLVHQLERATNGGR